MSIRVSLRGQWMVWNNQDHVPSLGKWTQTFFFLAIYLFSILARYLMQLYLFRLQWGHWHVGQVRLGHSCFMDQIDSLFKMHLFWHDKRGAIHSLEAEYRADRAWIAPRTRAIKRCPPVVQTSKEGEVRDGDPRCQHWCDWNSREEDHWQTGVLGYLINEDNGMDDPQKCVTTERRQSSGVVIPLIASKRNCYSVSARSSFLRSTAIVGERPRYDKSDTDQMRVATVVGKGTYAKHYDNRHFFETGDG